MRLSSFDIFDTCVTRTFAHPVDLFDEMGRRAAARGWITLAPAEFRRRRTAAEGRARLQLPSREATLEEIYRELGEDPDLRGADMAALRELELQLEEESIRPVPEMQRRIAEARQEGRQIAFLSDMYLPAPFLERLLAAHGMFQPGDRLYVSGERRMNKGTGALFGQVRKDLQVGAGEWVHVGDSRHGDVKMAKRVSIAAHLFSAGHLNGCERRICPGPPGDEQWRSRLAAAMRLARLEQPAGLDARQKVIWETGANLAGPLFYGYVQWMAREAERRGLSRLYFVARDGQVLWEIARIMSAVRGWSMDCRYLYGSRRAWLPASLGGMDRFHLEWILGRDPSLGTPREVFQRVGIRPEMHAPWLAALDLPPESWDEPLGAVRAHRLAEGLRGDSAFTAQIKALAAGNRDRALRYLEREGIFERDQVAIVDLGWHGSLKRALARVCAEGPDGRSPRVTAFYFALVGRGFEEEGGFAAYINSLCPGLLGQMLFSQQLLEAFAAADHGQTCDYDEQGQPVLAPGGGAAVSAWGLAALRGGMLAFARTYAALDDGSAPEADYARSMLGALELFFERPTLEEARIWGAFPFSDQQVETRLEPLLPDWTRAGTLRALLRKKGRARLWWPTGMARARGMPWLDAYYRLQKFWRFKVKPALRRKG